MKDTKEQIFKILDTGNFYFPLKDKGKKFTVSETLSIWSEEEDIVNRYSIIEEEYKQVNSFSLWEMATLAWKIIQSNKLDTQYKDNYLVPIRMNKIGKGISLTVDVLGVK